MAASKTIAVFSSAFSTNPTAHDIDLFSSEAVLDRAEQDEQFKRTHGLSRKDWDAALSLHWHGDRQ